MLIKKQLLEAVPAARLFGAASFNVASDNSQVLTKPIQTFAVKVEKEIIMKKTLSLFCAIFMALALSFSAQARDKYSHDASSLPPAATVFLDKYFKAEVSLVKIDKSFGRVSEYEVILRDGTEVTFDGSGNWKEIETSVKSKVPDKIVPQAIITYVKSHQNKSVIIGIEKDRRGYDVTLANGVEIEFDSAGNFLRYDH